MPSMSPRIRSLQRGLQSINDTALSYSPAITAVVVNNSAQWGGTLSDTNILGVRVSGLNTTSVVLDRGTGSAVAQSVPWIVVERY